MEKLLFGTAGKESAAELTQDRVVEAGIGQLQPQEILPVDAAAHGVRRLAVREVFRVLEQCDQRKAPGSFCRLASAREERGKGRIGEDRAQLIA